MSKGRIHIIQEFTSKWWRLYLRLQNPRTDVEQKELSKVIRRLGILKPEWVKSWDERGRPASLSVPEFQTGGILTAPACVNDIGCMMPARILNAMKDVTILFRTLTPEDMDRITNMFADVRRRDSIPTTTDAE